MVQFASRLVGQTSIRVSTLGLGTAPLGGLFDPVDGAEAAATLSEAYDAGIRYFDTAPFYGFGRSERRVGDGLRALPTYQLSTKVGRLLLPGRSPKAAKMGWPDALPFHPTYDYSYNGIMRSFEESLQRLGLDRIDMLLVHDIGEMTHGDENALYFKILQKEGYQALSDLRNSGRVGAIGLGVNEVQACLDALDIGDWDLFLLAGRYTLLEQGALDQLLPLCKTRGTSIVVGGPFNSGILVGGATWNYAEAPMQIIDKVEKIETVCRSFDVPMPAAALQFPLGHPSVCAVIPGLRNREELQQTLAWAVHDIPSDLWQALKDQDLLHPEAPTPARLPFHRAAESVSTYS